jgi:hypothetical protein
LITSVFPASSFDFMSGYDEVSRLFLERFWNSKFTIWNTMLACPVYFVDRFRKRESSIWDVVRLQFFDEQPSSAQSFAYRYQVHHGMLWIFRTTLMSRFILSHNVRALWNKMTKKSLKNAVFFSLSTSMILIISHSILVFLVCVLDVLS